MERMTSVRLGAARIWRNPPVRRLAWILAGIVLLSAVLAWLYVERSADRLHNEWLSRQTAIIGRLSADDPAKADEWARLLANPDTLTSADREKGRQLTEPYGLTPALNAGLEPIVSGYRDRSLAALFAGIVLLAVLLAVLLVREYRRQLADIHRLALTLEDTVKHNRPMAFRLYGEGELGILASGVQELSIRLRETIGQLHADKEFLKDTIADISHQLKTPLSSLIIYTDLLLEGNVDEERTREFLGTCRRELDRMEWLTLTLLKLARLEADAMLLQIRPASIPYTVERALNAVRRLAEDRQVSIVTVPPSPEAAELTEVPHDSRWLAEAIANLLKNAVEHSPSGGIVRAGWEKTPIFLRFYIEDDGPGIAEAELPRIFRKFYRGSSGGSGVGLGLPLAKTIAERHGGMLSAASRSEGGSRFVLTLPLHPLPAPEGNAAYNTVSEDTAEL
ncbi:sensor histidine kinase [Cohnella candidum]|uniref:histidine kinase n=1 Tax=Cohnella candidum TaxID=2674991 RepID=A0A3G3K2J9_9BACL|nr:HAMP domain-containing sensor histidine kinase [Cohnella candidum]AYQ74662.1 sensor histidine kinase [Cohnella candidum]